MSAPSYTSSSPCKSPSTTDDTSPMSFMQLIQGATIKVHVGSSETLFQLPRTMLCHHSKYFGRAFNGLFKETLEHRIHLEEDDPAIFALLIEWMYTQNLHVYKDHVYDAIDVQEPLKGACDTLCELFCMSEKLLVDGIQEDIKEELDRAFDRAGNHFPIEPHTIMAMYNNTHADSKFRKFILENLAANLVDCQGRHIKYYQDCIEGPDAIPGFSMDLMMKMKNERSKDFWSE